jgi:hypothetical protein
VTAYRYLGARSELGPLLRQLEAHGARPSQIPAPDLVLVSATTVEEATKALSGLPVEERARAVLVGVEGSLDLRERPEPGTMAHLLETFQPLGVLQTHALSSWASSGFIGHKELARKLGARYLNLYSSPSYSAWIGCPGDDAGDFLVRLVNARGT